MIANPEWIDIGLKEDEDTFLLIGLKRVPEKSYPDRGGQDNGEYK